jgi:hypothetical protein
LTLSQRIAPPITPLSNAARVAGATIALAYLLGLIPGPLVSVVGGLALVTLGRALMLPRTLGSRSALSLAILAGSLGAAALRWGTLDLTELRGVQSVLGPTVLVGPTTAAVACAVAFAGGLIALGTWVFEPRPVGRVGYIWSGLEVGLGTLALVTVFIDPARSALGGAGFGPALVELVRWLLAVAVAGGVVFGLAYLEQRLRDSWRWIALGCAGGAVAVAAALIASTL